MHPMFCLSRICSTCLQNNTNLVQIIGAGTTDTIGGKLSVCVTDVDWSFIKHFYICTACIQLVELSFNFRETCKKSADMLKSYIETLEKSNEENVKPLEGTIEIPLNKDDVPQKYIDEFNSRQVTPAPNVILPNNIYSFLTNSQFPIFNIIPGSTVVPVVPGQSFINQVPPLMLINSVPAKPPQPDATTKEVNDILNSEISEEVSVSVDPMAFNFGDDEDNLLDIVKEEPENLSNVTNGKIPTCHNCNAEFDSRRALKMHRLQHKECFNARKTYFQKGSKAAQCHICNRKFCTQQYLQHHLELHKKKGVVNIGRRKGRKPKVEIPIKPPPMKLAMKNLKENIEKKKIKKDSNKANDKKVTFSDEINIIKDETVKMEDSDDSDYSLEAMCIEPEITISLGYGDFEPNPLEENPLTPNRQNPLTPNRENPLTPNRENPLTPNRENPLTPNEENLLTPNRENSLTPYKESPLTPNSENPLTPNSENPLTPNEPNSSTVDDSPIVIEDDNPLPKKVEKPLVIDVVDSPVTSPKRKIPKSEDEPILIEDDENSQQEDQIGLLNGLRVKIVDGKSCCGYCGKLFECLDSLQQHISAIHHDKMHFKCQFCKKRFLESHKLKSHLPRHYNYFMCTCCNETFTSVSDVQSHMIDDHEDFEATKCVSCAKDFVTLDELKEHGELHLKNLVFVCHVCNEKFKDSETFTEHVLQHYKLYTCLFCQIQFYNESDFLTHFESHNHGS